MGQLTPVEARTNLPEVLGEKDARSSLVLLVEEGRVVLATAAIYSATRVGTVGIALI